MNELQKVKLKDDILRLLIKKQDESGTDLSSKYIHVREIADGLNQDIRLVTYLVEQFGENGLASLTTPTSLTELPKEYNVAITNKGIYYVSLDGGFLKTHKSIVWMTRWTATKTIAAIINALAILGLAFYSIYLADKTNKLEEENEGLKTKVEQLEKK